MRAPDKNLHRGSREAIRDPKAEELGGLDGVDGLVWLWDGPW